MKWFAFVTIAWFAFAYLAIPIRAQVLPGSPFTGGSGGGSSTPSFPLLAPDGSAGAPSYSFANEPTLGLYRSTAGVVQNSGSFSISATGRYYTLADGATGDPVFHRSPNQGIFFPSGGGTSIVGGPAVFGVGTNGENVMILAPGFTLRLGALADRHWEFGGPAEATGLAQILQGQNSTGSGTAGGALTVKGGAGTAGNANGGDLVLDGGAKAGTGVVGSVSLGGGQTGTGVKLDRTITAAGTTGAQTINKMAGTVNFAGSGLANIVVTNSLVTTSSIVFTTIRTADTTCTSVKSVVPAAGSFTITLNAGCIAETSVGFWVTN